MLRNRTNLVSRVALLSISMMIFLSVVGGCSKIHSNSDLTDGYCTLRITNKSIIVAEVFVSGKNLLSVSPGQTNTKKVNIGSEITVQADKFQEKFIISQPEVLIPLIRSIEYEVILDDPAVPPMITISDNVSSFFKWVTYKTTIINYGNIEANFGGTANEGTQKGKKVIAVNGHEVLGTDKVIEIGEHYIISQPVGKDQPLKVIDIGAATTSTIQKDGELELETGVEVDYSEIPKK
jgi:hypothetical protein